MLHLRLLSIALLSFASVSAQSWSDTTRAIDKIMETYGSTEPGCQLSISRGSTILYSKPFGMADMEHGVAMSLQTPTEAGSVSKQFTAAAILLLAQEGKLSVNDDIRKYFPELPDLGYTIRISNLLHHTSGLRDWGAVAALTGWPRTSKNYTNDDVLDIIAAQRGLNFLPGAEYGYSNSNFNLLAILVQRLTGKSLAEFTRERIFIPAGMTHTQWRDDHNRVVQGRAIAYNRTAAGYFTDMPGEDAYGNGGLLTTTEDLLKWEDFYLSGKLGGKPLLDQQLHVEPLNNGVANNYAAGLMLSFEGGKLTDINHSGSTAGYRANLEHLMKQNISIAWLANSSKIDTAKLKPAAAIKNLFDPKPANIAPPAANYKPSAKEMSDQQGWYRNDRTGDGIFIVAIEGRMAIRPSMNLTPISLGKYQYAGTLVQFTNHGVQFIQGKDTTSFTHVEPSNGMGLNLLVGEYGSIETGSTLRFKIIDNKPYLNVKPAVNLPLIQTYQDGFDIPDWNGNAYITRDANGNIIALYISIDRSRNVKFVRIANR